MKKLVALVLAGATMLMTGCGSTQTAETDAYKGQTLKFYNWGEYVGENVVADFEKQYGCKVISEYFDSNEMMYTKLQAGDAYDVIVPSDYMIERMKKEDMLQPLDKDKIPNLSKLTDKMSCDFDPDHEYSVPYFWGNVGILYDTTVVDPADLSEGWNLLMDTKYAGNLYMYDSERDSFMIALKALGYSMNTHDENEIQAAYEWLIQQRDTMKPVYAGDDVIDNMISGNKALAVVYSGDGAYIMSENEDLGFLMPEEGTNLWYDAMVMTRDCENTELAYEFMDFMLRDDVAYRNTQYVGYSSPVVAAYEQAQEEDYEGIEAYVPRVGYEKDEIFRYQDTDIKKLFAELWTKVKAQ